MKKLICALFLSGLASMGLAAPSSGKLHQPASIVSIAEVRQAHNVQQGPDALLAFTAEAVKLISYPGELDSESSSFFERKVKVSIGAGAFKRHRVDPLGVREQFDLFDGREVYHTVVETGKQVEEVNQMGDSPSGDLAFSIKTFGLVPVLKQLSDPATEILYLGRTARREDKFEVKTPTGSWTLYCDQRHIIRKAEIGTRSIEYADYRSVEGTRLPFIQRVYIGGRLSYELVFTSIDLNPTFPAGYFSREAFSKEIAR
jgi:hypothetical protein